MFKRKKFNLKRFAHRLTSAFAIILFWKGAWGLIDQYFGHTIEANMSCVILGVVLLTIDDFSIKELV